MARSKWKLSSIFLLVSSLASSTSYASNSYSEAVNKAADAFYKYEHWDQDVGSFVNKYDKMLTPRQKEIGGFIGLAARIVIEKRLQFVWRFP